MDIAEIIRRIGETVNAAATVKNVYGEPVTAGQRVILPVASIRFGFGGGGGSGHEGEKPVKGGGGGGGGVTAVPCGLVEVTPEGARFIYYHDYRKFACAVAIGLVAGYVLGRR